MLAVVTVTKYTDQFIIICILKAISALYTAIHCPELTTNF